jgi:hypothetical protein
MVQSRNIKDIKNIKRSGVFKSNLMYEIELEVDNERMYCRRVAPQYIVIAIWKLDGAGLCLLF